MVVFKKFMTLMLLPIIIIGFRFICCNKNIIKNISNVSIVLDNNINKDLKYGGAKESKNLLDLSIKVIDDLEFSSKEKSEGFKDNKLYLIDDYLRQDKNSKKLNKSI